MKTVFLYAGQGSQKPGMGMDLYEEFEEYREAIDDSAKADIGFDLKWMLEKADMETISLTENTQPAMSAFAAGVTNILKKNNIYPDAACGLSLGEYGALYAAGVIEDAKTYVGITAFRGKAMMEAARGCKCSMSAIIGLDADTVQEGCKANEDKGFVIVANYNCPKQYVICGDEVAVNATEEWLKEKGARRCIRLNVSGPFHTKYMESASVKLREYLENITFNKPQIPVVLNVTGDFYDGKEDLKDILKQQVKNSVHFEESIRKLIESGADTFIEIGPGNTLSGFVKKTAKDMGKKITTHSIETVADIKTVIEGRA